VQVLAALFAKVLVGASIFAHDAHAAAVLPDLANIALQEESGQVFCNICDIDYRFFNTFSNTMLTVFVRMLWRPWVFVEATNTPNGLVILSHFLHSVVGPLCTIACVYFDRF
jgi:hypothetical protein